MTDQDKVFAKCAWRLIPFMVLLFMVSFIDRTNAGFAALTIDDLANLTKETVITVPPPETLKTLLKDTMIGSTPLVKPLTEKYLTADDRETLKVAVRHHPDLLDKIANFFAEAARLMEAGDPLSEATMQWARRWSAFRKEMFGSDPGLKSG